MLFSLFFFRAMQVVFATAVISRIISVSIAYISSLAINNYDKSTDLVYTGSGVLRSLLRWDAIFFYTIAKKGYYSENSTAFFPLFPAIVSLLSGATGLEEAVVGVLLSNVLLVLSSLLLFRFMLGRTGYGVAKTATALFAFNPASIVYSTMYSESLFCFLFLIALLCETEGKRFLSLLFVCLCCTARSNGVLLACLFFAAPPSQWSRKDFCISVLRAGVALTVFLSIQLYWRHKVFLFLPLSTLPYSYVQKIYWNQGFLKFYTRDNIPNLLVGLPFVALSSFVICLYAQQLAKRLRAGARAEKKTSSLQFGSIGRGRRRRGKRERHSMETLKKTILRISRYVKRREAIDLALVFILLVQVLLSIFYIHMNMHFRFVSFNPIIYWMLAKFFYCSRAKIKRLLFFLYILFNFSYSALFGAHFPPA